MHKSVKFLNDKICLNVLSHDKENAKEIYEVTQGHVLIGMLSKNYETNEQAITAMSDLSVNINGALSIGLGAGDPKQWKMVAELAGELQAPHVNQICTATGFTRARLGQDETIVNALVGPTGRPGYVNMATGYLSQEKVATEVPIETAIAMLKEMGASSVKFFPMNGLETIEEYKAVCEACAQENFMIEPTGGITLDNFKEIIKIAIDAKVPKVIPHVYSSIIDKETGLTRIEDVKKLYEVMKEVSKA
ncbi:2-dehydro-3-deoxy-phosphogluconate aldolase [Erysipelothrix urinaevulpis]|uniref:2-dehydro-3-deoxy-phosphogluconate aldolase n=1 Tax=Erysipelothrix urinaevulpis TaxID=2683717 RepID=UPI001356A4D2|nr:KDGP aldolase [Erysipelothrix urinaevulpis]